jgi:hypothetical protein
MAKLYKVISSKNNRTSEYIGTISDLLEIFSYTIECGKSYEHEKGNYKINTNPKGIKSLISTINKSRSNAAANGYSNTKYYEGIVTDEDKLIYKEEN